MIELTVTKVSEDPSKFILSPSAIELGGKGANKVDYLHVNIPPDWVGKIIEVTFNQNIFHGGKKISAVLGESNTIELTSDITSCGGDIGIKSSDENDYVSPSTGCHYTVYDHPDTNGIEQSIVPNDYNQFTEKIKGYVDEANTSKSAAAQSETNSTNSATAAALSEANAKASETASATSATASAGSSTSAADSATAASASKSAASLSESNAKASETAAKASETNAAGSATAASNSASESSTNASAALQSETNSKTSETAAKASETNSENSAIAAATSEANAESAKSAAIAAQEASQTSAIAAESAKESATQSAAEAETAKNQAESAAIDAQATNIVSPQSWTDDQKSIARENINVLSIFQTKLNLVDPLQIVTGVVISNGIEVINSSYDSSGYIPVISGQHLYQQSLYSGAFYNKEKVYLSSKSYGISEFDVPANAFFYRTSFDHTNILRAFVSTYNKHYFYNDNHFVLDSNAIKAIKSDLLLDINNTSFAKEERINLFDKNSVTSGYSLNAAGNFLQASQGTNVSDYMSVKANTTYYIPISDSIAFVCYDNNLIYLGYVLSSNKSFTTLENTAYIKCCSVADSYLSTFYVSKNQVFTDYNTTNVMFLSQGFKNAITALQSGNLSNHKWIAFGDSLTEKNVTAVNNYTDIIMAQTGINCVNMGKSGTGYKRTEENSTAFYQRILSVPTDADVITIFGSGNDQLYNTDVQIGTPTDVGTTTICGCINTTIDGLFIANPLVKLGIITPTPWAEYAPNNINATWMDRYSKKIIDICNLRGIPCLDLYHCSGLRPWDSTHDSLFHENDSASNTHPNDEGHKWIAPHIVEFLKTLIY